MTRCIVLDTSAIVARMVGFTSRNFTTSLIVEEARKYSFELYESIYSDRIIVIDPSRESIESAREAADSTGDLQTLSEADISLIALAHSLSNGECNSVTIFSDDYSILNVAASIGLGYSTVALRKPRFEEYKWRWYCPRCHRFYTGGQKSCLTCDVVLKRKPWNRHRT